MTILNNARFELGERRSFAGEYSWRLKDGELRYRGTKQFQGLIAGRIPVIDRQLHRFVAVLDLLDVWNWRSDYRSEEVGVAVLGGGSWWFKAEIVGRIVQAGGVNAYPAYEDPQQTSVEAERFRLLVAGLYDAFSIDASIEYANRQAAREQSTQQRPTGEA